MAGWPCSAFSLSADRLGKFFRHLPDLLERKLCYFGNFLNGKSVFAEQFFHKLLLRFPDALVAVFFNNPAHFLNPLFLLFVEPYPLGMGIRF